MKKQAKDQILPQILLIDFSGCKEQAFLSGSIPEQSQIWGMIMVPPPEVF